MLREGRGRTVCGPAGYNLMDRPLVSAKNASSAVVRSAPVSTIEFRALSRPVPTTPSQFATIGSTFAVAS